MVELTKMALAESLMILLENEPISKITISKITSRCNMTRNTFYYHFHDIYELLMWIFKNQAEEILKEYEKENSKLTLKDGLIMILEDLMKNKNIIYNVYEAANRTSLEKYMSTVFEIFSSKILKIYINDYQVNDETKRIITDFYKNAFYGEVVQWIDGGMKEDPEWFGEMSEAVFVSTLPNLLKTVEQRVEKLNK